MAKELGAVNLGQGFPDCESNDRLAEGYLQGLPDF